jgi:hypothetical protein
METLNPDIKSGMNAEINPNNLLSDMSLMTSTHGLNGGLLVRVIGHMGFGREWRGIVCSARVFAGVQRPRLIAGF